MQKHQFRLKGKRKKKTIDDDEEENELDEEEAAEWEEEYIETEAFKYIQEGDIAVIKTGDDHQYYLLKLTANLYEQTTDGRVVTGHYLEVHQEQSNSK